jgi:hypothetical protein
MLCVYVHVCPLCDLVFLRAFQEDYHTIVSGYNLKTNTYQEYAKYPVNHILRNVAQFTLTEAELNGELEDSVALIKQKTTALAPLYKQEPELEYNIRKIVLDYFTNREVNH